MGLTLKLTRNVSTSSCTRRRPSCTTSTSPSPYLYDNTVGDGPYNAWLDPILTNEWQMLGWNNVQEMTRFGMPGVFTHGTFDTWTPGYLMFIAATHNGISRLYETFGNGGADTVERTLAPGRYSRTLVPAEPAAAAREVVAAQQQQLRADRTSRLAPLFRGRTDGSFLENFYRKASARSKSPPPKVPAAYVFPADDPRPGAQAELLRILQLQGCEISRATSAVLGVRGRHPQARADENEKGSTKSRRAAPDSVRLPRSRARRTAGARGARRAFRVGVAGRPGGARERRTGAEALRRPKEKTRETRELRSFPPEAYVVRMDQPYSRIADMLLDYQYWSPDDPQKSPYDDTGWTFGELFHVQVRRVSDPAILKAAMAPVPGPVTAPGGLDGTGPIVAIAHNGDSALATLRFRFPAADFRSADAGFQGGGRRFPRGSFLVRGVPASEMSRALRELGLAGRDTRRPAGRGHASPARAAHRHAAHVALDTGRGLVEARLRQARHSLRGDQHANGRGHTRISARDST